MQLKLGMTEKAERQPGQLLGCMGRGGWETDQMEGQELCPRYGTSLSTETVPGTVLGIGVTHILST